jgi:hypothetical protein
MWEIFLLKVQWNAYSSWMIMDTAIGLYPTPLADAEIQLPNGSKAWDSMCLEIISSLQKWPPY